MNKLISLCAVFCIVSLLSSQAFAAETTTINGTRISTTFERAQEPAALSTEAFALTKEWEVPLRKQPAANAPEIATCFDGVTVHLLDGGDDDWAHVRVSNLEGYMLREQLVFDIDKDDTSPRNGGLGYVARRGDLASLPVRQHPTSDSAMVGDVPVWAAVRVLGITQDQQWVSILYKQMDDPNGKMNIPYGEKNDGTFDDAIMGFVPTTSIFVQVSNHMEDTISFDDPRTLLALRTAPSTSAELLGEYYSGTTVNFLFSSHIPEGWPRVEIFGVAGYVQYDNLHSFCSGCGDSLPYLPPLVTTKTAGEGAKLYPDPSVTSDPIGSYPEGSGIEVMGVIGEWGHVRAQDGKYGFMQLSDLGGKPDSAESTQYKTMSEITLHKDPFDNAKTGDVLSADTVITLWTHGFDRWLAHYDVDTGYREQQWIDHDWVYISTHPFISGYVRWSELEAQLEPALP